MIFFTTLIFIAELVIATALIVSIVKASRRVNSLNLKLMKSQYKVVIAINRIKSFVKYFSKFAEDIEKSLVKKQKMLVINTLKNIIFSTLFLILGKKYKKTVLAVQLGLVFYDGLRQKQT